MTFLNFIFKQFIVNTKIRLWIWAVNSIEPGQTTRKCRLASLQTGVKALYYSELTQHLSSHKCMNCISVLPPFQIKRLNSACSVSYLHRKSNSIVLMYVNLFFIKSTKASIFDSRKTIKYWHRAANCYLDSKLARSSLNSKYAAV